MKFSRNYAGPYGDYQFEWILFILVLAEVWYRFWSIRRGNKQFNFLSNRRSCSAWQMRHAACMMNWIVISIWILYKSVISILSDFMGWKSCSMASKTVLRETTVAGKCWYFVHTETKVIDYFCTDSLVVNLIVVRRYSIFSLLHHKNRGYFACNYEMN